MEGVAVREIDLRCAVRGAGDAHRDRAGRVIVPEAHVEATELGFLDHGDDTHIVIEDRADRRERPGADASFERARHERVIILVFEQLATFAGEGAERGKLAGGDDGGQPEAKRRRRRTPER